MARGQFGGQDEDGLPIVTLDWGAIVGAAVATAGTVIGVVAFSWALAKVGPLVWLPLISVLIFFAGLADIASGGNMLQSVNPGAMMTIGGVGMFFSLFIIGGIVHGAFTEEEEDE